MSHIRTHLLGYPRIGEHRELKKITELHWRGELPLGALEEAGRGLRRLNWAKQRAAGIDLVPCNDFSFYDQMLDMSALLGNLPPRFGNTETSVAADTLFRVARGESGHVHDNDCSCRGGNPASAAEMTKWFDTNYHYLVPEFRADTSFRIGSTKVFDEFAEARALGLNAKPVLIGPVTYLSLGKVRDIDHPDFDRFELLDRALPVYEEILRRLAAQGAEWIQIDEPVLALDLSHAQRDAFLGVYGRLRAAAGPAKLLVTCYFGGLRDNLDLYLSLPVAGLHFDLTRGAEDLEAVLATYPAGKILSLGVVDGRNIWKNHFTASLAVLRRALDVVGPERLWVAPSCSLLHTPVTLENEPNLDAEARDWFAFADEKMGEISALRDILEGTVGTEILEENIASLDRRTKSPRIHQASVRERTAAVTPADSVRHSTFPERQRSQRERLKLPPLPTTTIGSFPQTSEVRAARAKWRKGQLRDADYTAFLREETQRCVAFQDEIGIDMPVHGEFERNDMVEYFGEQLDGFLFTANGWVQSYGTRCVKPPVIFGDVSRPRPMTVEWAAFAQSLTTRPMKGMLTGPVTILQWSFVRDDQPRSTTTRQIALAIRDEVRDLEAAGIAAIQIDEPALREGLPLRARDRTDYLTWAVEAFRLCSSGVRDETQIHTHMCYSEFNDIIQSIADMDADVITIETSRSNMELLDAFADFRYPNEIGPGVYDIHSPRVPSVEEMKSLLEKAAAVLPLGNLWINPDCGLKTRGWPEVKESLSRMVECARLLRAETASTPTA